jgi:hypothetical protein
MVAESSSGALACTAEVIVLVRCSFRSSQRFPGRVVGDLYQPGTSLGEEPVQGATRYLPARRVNSHPGARRAPAA